MVPSPASNPAVPAEIWKRKYDMKSMECLQLRQEINQLKNRCDMLKEENNNVRIEKDRQQHAAEFMDAQLYRKRGEIEDIFKIIAERHGGQVTQADPCIPLTYRLSQAMGDSLNFGTSGPLGNGGGLNGLAATHQRSAMSFNLGSGPSWPWEPTARGVASAVRQDFTETMPPSPDMTGMPTLNDERMPPSLSLAPLISEEDEADSSPASGVADEREKDYDDMDTPTLAHENAGDNRESLNELPPPLENAEAESSQAHEDMEEVRHDAPTTDSLVAPSSASPSGKKSTTKATPKKSTAAKNSKKVGPKKKVAPKEKAAPKKRAASKKRAAPKEKVEPKKRVAPKKVAPPKEKLADEKTETPAEPLIL